MRSFVLVSCIVSLATPPLGGQTPALPPVIRAGMEAFKVRGHDAALARWIKDSPITDPSEAAKAFTQIESVYGRMTGYEVLDVVPFGTYSSRSYLVILFEKGPVYARFDCFRPKDDWVIIDFVFNTKPDPILPATMMSH